MTACGSRQRSLWKLEFARLIGGLCGEAGPISLLSLRPGSAAAVLLSAAAPLRGAGFAMVQPRSGLIAREVVWPEPAPCRCALRRFSRLSRFAMEAMARPGKPLGGKVVARTPQREDAFYEGRLPR